MLILRKYIFFILYFCLTFNLYSQDNRDIFSRLFSDIKFNYAEYGDDYIVNPYHENYCTVSNDYIHIFYALESGKPRMIDVTIEKYSNKYYLSKYIGRHFEEVLKDFDNKYEVGYSQRGDTALKHYKFRKNYESWIEFYIDDNDIIYKIVYRIFGSRILRN
jgi:hypothetical protein